MALRYYRNGPARALAVPLANATDTSITVDSASGFPTQFPYTLILDPDQSTEEVVDATAAVGNVITIVRGVDSTTAVAHGAGAVVYHGVSARDPREANEHVNAVANVHGTTGALVDTDSLQNIPGRKIFSDLETVGGGDVMTLGAAQTATGTKTFSAVLTANAGMVVAGTESHAGTETHAGAVTFTGTESHTNTETHSGLLRFSNAALQAVSVVSSTDEGPYAGAAFFEGASPVGLTFVAPTSGKGFVTLSSYFNQAIDGHVSIVSYTIREGAVIGSGATSVAASADRALTAGRAVNTGSPPQVQASRRSLITGLTPGASYNVRVEFQTTAGGSITVFVRELLWEPHL